MLPLRNSRRAGAVGGVAGQDPQTHRWGIPIREVWGLRPHQRMSPALEDKLVFTATLAASDELAAQVADKWGRPVDDSVIHALVQRLGRRAEGQIQQRLKSGPPAAQTPPRRGRRGWSRVCTGCATDRSGAS